MNTYVTIWNNEILVRVVKLKKDRHCWHTVNGIVRETYHYRINKVIFNNEKRFKFSSDENGMFLYEAHMKRRPNKSYRSYTISQAPEETIKFNNDEEALLWFKLNY